MRDPFGRVLVGVLAVQFFEFVEFLQHEFRVFADPVDAVRATDVGIPAQFIVGTAEVLFVGTKSNKNNKKTIPTWVYQCNVYKYIIHINTLSVVCVRNADEQLECKHIDTTVFFPRLGIGPSYSLKSIINIFWIFLTQSYRICD